MYTQITDNNLVAWAGHQFAGWNKEFPEIDYNDYQENPNKYIFDGEDIALNPNYEEEQAQKERERILELKMTRSDFFDGTIMAWGVNEKLLLPLIQNMLLALQLDEKLKLKALNNFENAQNFYRKHDLFKMIVNIPLQLTDSIQVIITDEHLDKFFDEVDKGNKDTAWEYLPQPMAITQ